MRPIDRLSPPRARFGSGASVPIDQRTITFTQSELKDAFFGYCRATGRKLCDPALMRLRIASTPPITVIVEGVVPGKATVFEETDIAAALILYCRHEKIPLAKQAVKSLRIVSGSIALCTRWQSPIARMNAA